MQGANILLATDDCETSRFWSYAINMRGANVVAVEGIENAFARYQQGLVDLSLIFSLREEYKGIEMANMLRPIAFNPILLVVPRYDEALVMRVYNAGVDECIVSPVSPPVLLAKLTAWLRHTWTVSASSVPIQETDCLSLDPQKRSVVTPFGQTVKLTNLELRLLSLLMLHRGQILESEQIVNRVWGYPEIGDSEMLKSLVYRLRNKIERDPRNPQFILTVPGEGYIFNSTNS